MKLSKYQKEAIVRAIMNDVPKPDKSKRHAIAQAAIVKAMSPECRKVFNKTSNALATSHTGDVLYDINYSQRSVIIGDAPKEALSKVLQPYENEDENYRKAYRNLEKAIMGCSTLAGLKKLLPEFDKYYPTETEPTKNLPAIANVVADLSKIGWPKK